MGLLGDVRTTGGLWEHFSATPAARSTPQILLLGSSGYSAQLAGLLGLPFVFAHHFDTGGTLEALDLYRKTFQESPALSEPMPSSPPTSWWPPPTKRQNENRDQVD